jgi:hypothetical protein
VEGQKDKPVACGWPMIVVGGKWTAGNHFCMQGLEP